MASRFLDARKIAPEDAVPASRKLGRRDAVALAKAASRVLVAKGKKLDSFKPGGKAPKACVDAMLGPTGNLRAPCLRAGKTVVVGFNEEVFRELFA